MSTAVGNMAISNTFEQGGRVLSRNLDILVIEKVDIDSICPEAQFYIPGYKKPLERTEMLMVGE